MVKFFTKGSKMDKIATSLPLVSIAVFTVLILGGCNKNNESAAPTSAAPPVKMKSGQSPSAVPVAAPVGAAPVQAKS